MRSVGFSKSSAVLDAAITISLSHLAKGALEHGLTIHSDCVTIEVDLHPRVFGEGACTQTMIAHTNVLLIPVRDPDRDEALDIVVRRSFADHLTRWLMDAAAEGGYEFLSPAGST